MTATYPDDHPTGRVAVPWFVRATQRLEGAAALDPAARSLTRFADLVVGRGRRKEALQGRWVGHAVHPLLVTVPIGTWTSVSLLDVLGGDAGRETARTLTGFGLLAAVPSVVTGWAEIVDTTTRDRRTATVHAVANSVGLVLYARSWAARRAGRHGAGAALAAAGLSAVSAGGYLGGHLTQVRKVGSHHPAFAADA